MIKKIVVFLMFLSVFAATQAQLPEFLDRNFKQEFKLDGVEIWGAALLCSGTAQLEVVDFGAKGRTIILNLNSSEWDKELKEQGIDPKMFSYFSWSGKSIHLVKSIQNGGEMYAVLRVVHGQTIPCAAIAKSEGKLMVILPENDEARKITILYDFAHKGMGRTEVENRLAKDDFNLKFIRKVGNLSLWTSSWVQVEKMNRMGLTNGTGQVGDFYFNENNKLIKWIMNLD